MGDESVGNVTNIKTRTLKCKTLWVEWMKEHAVDSSVILQAIRIHFCILQRCDNQHHSGSNITGYFDEMKKQYL